jgi:hypothetical protein
MLAVHCPTNTMSYVMRLPNFIPPRLAKDQADAPMMTGLRDDDVTLPDTGAQTHRVSTA